MIEIYYIYNLAFPEIAVQCMASYNLQVLTTLGKGQENPAISGAGIEHCSPLLRP